MSGPLFTDEDVERGAEAMSRHYAAAPFLTSDLTTTQAVLDAVLPAYTARLLRDLAREFSDLPEGHYDRDVVVRLLDARADEVTR